jgi:putative hydrolase of the HAD superfamily
MKMRMAVVSNLSNPEAVSLTLEKLHLARFFEKVFVSSAVGFVKPDQRTFERCIEAIEIPATHAVFIGDSLSTDIAGAEKIGMRTIIFAPEGAPSEIELKYTRPDFVVWELLEVPKIVFKSHMNHDR